MSIMSLGALISISVLNPKDNLISWQMLLGVLGSTVLMIILSAIWERIWKITIKFKWLFPILTSLFAITLFIISIIGRNEPASSDDYGRVWNAAWSLAHGEEIQDAYYLMNYSNNIKPMLLLYLVFRFSACLSIDDPFYIILLINVIGVVASICGLHYILNNDNNRSKYGVPVIVCYICCLPIWAMTQTFYTDAMSLCFSVVIIALAKKMFTCQNKILTVLLCIIMGILLALGMDIKVTILIPLIAASIVYIIIKDCSMNKKTIGCFCCILLSFGIAQFSFDTWANSFEITQESKVTEDPIITWIGLGLKEDGSFHANLDYINTVHDFSTKAEKEEYCKDYIRENFRYFYDLEHIVAKIRCTYASGHLGSAEFSYIAKYKDNILWQLFSPWGRFYWRSSQMGFCYLHSLFSVCFIGNIITVYRYIKDKKHSKTLMLFDLAMLGYFLFLLIWEANNRQLYNMLPILIGAAILNGKQIVECIEFLRNIIIRRKAN